MPFVGQLSSTPRSFGPGAYAPIDDAYTSAGTPAAAAARNTRALPSTESTAGSSASERSTLVPTFPLAPTTTTRIAQGYPPILTGNDVAAHRAPPGARPTTAWQRTNTII